MNTKNLTKRVEELERIEDAGKGILVVQRDLEDKTLYHHSSGKTYTVEELAALEGQYDTIVKITINSSEDEIDKDDD